MGAIPKLYQAALKKSTGSLSCLVSSRQQPSQLTWKRAGDGDRSYLASEGTQHQSILPLCTFYFVLLQQVDSFDYVIITLLPPLITKTFTAEIFGFFLIKMKIGGGVEFKFEIKTQTLFCQVDKFPVLFIQYLLTD